MHLSWKFSDVMAASIADYLVILKVVRPNLHGKEPGDPLQSYKRDLKYELIIQIHKSWGMFTRLSKCPPLHQTFMKMITRPESITS